MAGAGYKLFNTGDVLTAAQVNTYLMEQTVMVFADAAARTTALSGVVSEGMISYLKDTNAVEVYDGSNWVSSDDPNAIQNTIVDAKGDLISASAADTPARLAVGNNGETLVADSSTSTGLRWQGSQAAGKNYVINGAFDIWQRGTSLTATSTYSADRWFRGGGVQTTSRQLTNDTTNLPFIQYCARVQRNAGSSNTGQINLGQPMETVNSIPLAGRQIVLSYYARRGADFSGTSNLLGITLWTGTGTDQNVFSSYTGSATPIDTAVTMTTSWQRFSHTVTLASTVTEITPVFFFNPIGTAGTNDYFEITGIQLEVGAVPTQFSRAGATIAGEFQLACRYYWRDSAANSNSAYKYFANVADDVTGTGTALGSYFLPVPMRTSPSFAASGNFMVYRGGISAATSVTMDAASPNTIGLAANGLTSRSVGAGGNLRADNNNTAYLEFSAEL